MNNNSLQHVWTWLAGKKTYLIALAATIYAWGIQQGIWAHSGLMDTALGAGGLAALRHGFSTTVVRALAAAMANPPQLPNPNRTDGANGTNAPLALAGKAGFVRLSLLVGVAGLSLVLFTLGCAGFVNGSQKSIAAAAGLGDGMMKGYAVYWKGQTNKLGDTVQLETQRSNAMVISFKVGASLNTAKRTLADFQANLGTNTPPKAVVQALIQTAIQDAGSLAGVIAVLTGDPSWLTKAQ